MPEGANSSQEGAAISGRTALLFSPGHQRNLWRADKQNHPRQATILTYHREESCVEFTSQNARRELTHESLEQSRNGMWVPVLIRSE